jgi:hypothetical protein
MNGAKGSTTAGAVITSHRPDKEPAKEPPVDPVPPELPPYEPAPGEPVEPE